MGLVALPMRLWRGLGFEFDAFASTGLGALSRRLRKSILASIGARHNVRCTFLGAEWHGYLVRVGQTIPRNGSSSPRPNSASVLQMHPSPAVTRFVRILL